MKAILLLRLLAVSAAAWLLPPGVARGQNVATGNPHGALPANADCSDCHTAAGWKTTRPASKFDHGRDTRFPLTGMHAAVRCTGCHLDLRFDEPRVALAQCESCHADVHRGNLVGACVRCHNTRSFHDVPAVAVHNRTAFPLMGAHLQAPCESCHRTERNGAYTAVARDCVSCHQSALAQATIDHSSFPRDCTTCHSPFAWSGGVSFDHALAAHGFRLEGAHALLRCASCHLPGGSTLRFTPAPAGSTDCFACHQPDYQRAHAGNGYPTTCTGCHHVTSWSSNFNHDQAFPISSGAHRGNSCATCHPTPGNFQAFTCLTCHEHAKASMDSKHQGRSGYAYDSPSCYRCHPRGSH